MDITQKKTEASLKKGITKPKKSFFSPVIMKKLQIGSANDSYEVEADNMANRVMYMKAPSKTNINPTGSLVQRKCEACEQEEKIQKKSLAESITPLIQRSSTEKGGEASTHVENQINSSKGSGATMDGKTKTFMETRFGTDFSDIKIHTGSQAVQMSRELNAQAFTVGNDIYFNEGKYNPNSDSGKHLLAHELTHTIQQSSGIEKKVQRIPTQSGIEEGRYNFSTHCGWIDWSHASPTVPQRLIQEIQNASDRIAAGGTTPQPVFAPAMESNAPYIGTLLSGVTPHFTITRALSSSEVLQVALRLWQMQSLGFEALQNWTESIGASSFSEEDLTSNIIAFYQAAQSLNRSQIRSMCDIWNEERSVTHFETYHFTRWGSFQPPHLPSGGSWPFNTIIPAPLDGSMMSVPDATFETTTDSGRYSLGGIHLIMEGGLEINSLEGETIDISSTSTDDSDAPRFEIAPLTISNDLQFRWIIADDSDRRYLMWGDSGDVKHFGNHPSAFIRHRTRDLLRRENISSARILCRAITGRNQPGGVQRLYTKQVNFTW